MDSTGEVHVNIGEVKIGRSGVVLKALLGSCVGIAFLWKKKGVYGLAHCLLPETNVVMTKLNAKFVNHAVPSLMLLMNITPKVIGEIEVHIAGGANMMPQVAKTDGSNVGGANIEAARKTLKQFGFKVIEVDLGGFQGRQISIDCTEEKVIVHRLEKQL